MKQKADLILVNAKIHTVDSMLNITEAMAVSKGKILGTGTSKSVLDQFTSPNIHDAGGKPVFPGFIDAHCHYYGYALNIRSIDLTGCNSFKEVLSRLQSRAKAGQGEWIVGRGWDQNRWADKHFPDRSELDRLFPANPVVLTRIDGHVVLANGYALEKAGIGTIRKFDQGQVEVSKGKMTGILSETAADFMRNAVPQPDPGLMLELLKKAANDCFACGLTAVSDAGLSTETTGLLESLSESQDSTWMIRIYAMLDPSLSNIETYVKNGPLRKPFIRVSSVKLYADGSLGSRTALLKEPYEDQLCQTGILVTPPDSIRKICRICLDNGYQVNTHAIGDSANKLILDIYSEFLKERNDLRWRLEHCQVVDPADLHKFADYSVIPSVQATHATSDMGWAEDRLGGKRIKWAYAYHDLLKQNGWIANGTDFPIENISPIMTFYAAVARKNSQGKPQGGFQPENALSREDALRSITIWAAMADLWDDEIGSLETGKNADFVILDRDIMEIGEEEIPQTKVLETYVSGRQVYKSGKKE